MLPNIDKPRRTATLHTNGCHQLPTPLGTKFKLLGKLGRDGGWFDVESETEALLVANREFPSADFIRCQHC